MTFGFHRSIAVLILGLLLAGCITTAEQQAQRNQERCTARGYQPKTDAFNDCIVRLENESEARRDARHRETVERTTVPPYRQ
jgi:hypothetical protein